MITKVGSKAPYFEFLDGIQGKNYYDLKQKYHVVIYKAEKDDLEKYEEEFERANVKLIDYVQITTKNFLDQFGLDENGDFFILIDQHGTVQYVSETVPSFSEVMNLISFAEDEGCCAL
ncbi:MAG: hypothetical protein GXN94_05525 [Aquificae bacterium]|nr:hypothetical protein [Aquificota bacterium]